MNTLREYRRFDFLLFAVVAALAVFGTILVGSAAGVSSDDYASQKVWLVTGFFLLLAVAFVNYEFISRFYIPIYGVMLLLIVAALVQGYLLPNRSHSRMLTIGPVGIMPSEFAKLFLIIVLAKIIDKHSSKINSLLFLLILCVAVAIPAVLIQRMPSLSASMVSVFILVIMLFAAKIKYKYIIIVLLVGVPVALFVYYDIHAENHILIDKILQPYQLQRILDNNTAEKHEQTMQGIYAIGSGQLTGKGLYNNAVTVYEAQNDFIFSVLGAEFGFVGCLAVLSAMFFVICRCLVIANRSADLLGKLIASSVAGMFAFQVIVNVGVNTGVLPNTGMALPFFSAGGSSMWINMACIGLVLNVGMTRKKSMFE